MITIKLGDNFLLILFDLLKGYFNQLIKYFTRSQKLCYFVQAFEKVMSVRVFLILYLIIHWISLRAFVFVLVANNLIGLFFLFEIFLELLFDFLGV